MAAHSAPVGFIGLGVMGEPMAVNLMRAGTPLLVWNRSPGKTRALERTGAEAAPDAATVLARASVIILMLADEAATDGILGRGTPAFAQRVADRTIVSMGTPAPDYSQALEADILAAGGRYVEAPVSGSRVPAQNGDLIAMMAGDRRTVQLVRPLLAPMCRDIVVCGPVPNGLRMKLSVNVFLIAMVTALAEAVQFARRQDLDLAQLAEVLAASPMASAVMHMKAPKLLAEDFDVQVSVTNVWKNTRLITEAAALAGAASPLLGVCRDLYAEAAHLGLGDADMAAVVKAIEARADRRRPQ